MPIEHLQFRDLRHTDGAFSTPAKRTQLVCLTFSFAPGMEVKGTDSWSSINLTNLDMLRCHFTCSYYHRDKECSRVDGAVLIPHSGNNLKVAWHS